MPQRESLLRFEFCTICNTKSWTPKACCMYCTFSQSTPIFVLFAAVLTHHAQSVYNTISGSMALLIKLVQLAHSRSRQPLILGCEPPPQHSNCCDSTEDDVRVIERVG
jgi:hypothetical protein